MRIRSAQPICLVVLIAGAHLGALDLPVMVYGVIDPGQLTTAQNAWFTSQSPSIFTTLHLGVCAIPMPEGTPVGAFAALPIYHAVLSALVTGNDPGPYAMSTLSVVRIEAVTRHLGNTQTNIVMDSNGNAAGYLPFTTCDTALKVYAIIANQVDSINLVDGFRFPTNADAQNFRWWSELLLMPGSLDGAMLAGGGSDLGPLSTSLSTPLADYAGAWVQLIGDAGSYLYVPQSAIHSTAGIFDPVLYDGGFIAGGTYQEAPPGSGTAMYPFMGQQSIGQFPIDAACLATSLPPAIATLALSSESPAPPPEQTTTVNHIASNTGPLPVLTASLSSSSAVVEFSHGGQTADQSTATLASQVLQQGALSQSVDAVDNAPTSAGDRISTATAVAGSTGLNQLQAQQIASTWNQAPTVGSANATQIIVYGSSADGTPVTETIDSQDYLQAQDAMMNAQVSTTYNDQGQAQTPQSPPLALRAGGTLQVAQSSGASDEYYSKADAVNALIAPHMENTTWPGGTPAIYHKAIILPIDYLDAALVPRFAAATGITIPDKLGNPEPGDGTNPFSPVPQGCVASHPFYDVDGDGCLDRWYSNDPYDAGYRKLRISWAVETGPAKQLGSFSFQPDDNVVVSGLKKPRLNDTGVYAVQEDLLFSVGHQHLPFDHRTLRWNGFTTYYSSSLISPIDPINAGDPTAYQLAIRQVAANPVPGSGTDGADALQLVPQVETAQDTVSIALSGTGLAQSYTRLCIFSWYTALASTISPSDPWVWSWAPGPPSFPASVADRPGVPAVLVIEILASDGTILQQSTFRRPVFSDPVAGPQPFDPSLIPVSDPGLVAGAAQADSYIWDYPASRSTAEGGTTPADPANWIFPWNLAWNPDPHSQRYSAQTFALNSANLQYFPAFAGQSPLITHAGLTAQAAGLDSAAGAQWLLRENVASDPAAGQAVAAWRDGLALYPLSGWGPGQEWMSLGRSPVHAQGWDARSDLWAANRATGGCLQGTGQRIFDVYGGVASYVYRGQTITVANIDQQIALLQRMWNYTFTGYEHPQEDQTCLPSLLIPQRFDNADIGSPLLNTASIPVATSTSPPSYANDDRNDANHAGALDGSLTDELSQPLAAQYRTATLRRSRLMSQQIYIFSAARGREWELEMARHMPASTQLLCMEYDDRSAVKAALAGNGDTLIFPITQVSSIPDGSGGSAQVSISNEQELLRKIAQGWFDGAPIEPLGYANGQVGTSPLGSPVSGYSLQGAPTGNDPQARSGSAATTITASQALSASDGFIVELPGGMPAALAHFCYYLRSSPMFPIRQWSVDPQQMQYQEMTVEFRHPMLILYHDLASAIYVHYGRNCEPFAVFGNWAGCASPPANISATSSEFLRREAFKSWQTIPLLNQIYGQLSPGDQARYLTSLLPLPAAPLDPGPAPVAPPAVPFPGTQPIPPTGNPGDEPIFGQPSPWQGLAGFSQMGPTQAAAAYLTQIQPMPLLDWTVSVYAGGQGFINPVDVGPLANGGGYPLQISINDQISSYANGFYEFTATFECTNSLSPTMQGTIYCDNDGTLSINDQEIGYFIYQDGLVPFTYDFLPGQTYRLSIDHQGYDTPNVLYLAFTSADFEAQEAAVSAWLAAYQSWQQADTIWQAENSTYQSALSSYQAGNLIWHNGMASYLTYLQEVASYPAIAGAWATQNAVFTAWSNTNADRLALQIWAQQWLQDRSAWVAAVQSQAMQPGVSWPGDPAVGISTLPGLLAIQPQLPIWQAYTWFVDPANAINAALIQGVGP